LVFPPRNTGSLGYLSSFRLCILKVSPISISFSRHLFFPRNRGRLFFTPSAICVANPMELFSSRPATPPSSRSTMLGFFQDDASSNLTLTMVLAPWLRLSVLQTVSYPNFSAGSPGPFTESAAIGFFVPTPYNSVGELCGLFLDQSWDFDSGILIFTPDPNHAPRKVNINNFLFHFAFRNAFFDNLEPQMTGQNFAPPRAHCPPPLPLPRAKSRKVPYPTSVPP